MQMSPMLSFFRICMISATTISDARMYQGKYPGLKIFIFFGVPAENIEKEKGWRRFYLSENWSSDNFDECDWSCSDPVRDCLSQLRVHSPEKTKYNQQQRQIKQALLCKSKSAHWLQAVKERRKEIVDFGQNSPSLRSRLMLSLALLLIVMSTNGLILNTLNASFVSA